MSRLPILPILVSIAILLASGLIVASFLTSVGSLSSTTIQSSKLKNYLTSLPSQIVLEWSDRRYATASSTLITSQSLEAFFPKEQGLDVFYKILFPETPLPPNPFDETRVKIWIQQLATEIDLPSQEPKLEYKKDKPGFSVFAGEKGLVVNQEQTLQDLLSLDIEATNSAKITTQETGPVLFPDAIIQTEKRATAFLGAKLVLQTKLYSKTLTAKDLFPLLTLPTGYSDTAIASLFENISKDVGTLPVEPELVIEDNKVKTFVAPRDGIGVDSEENKKLLLAELENIEQGIKPKAIPLAVTKQSPKTTLKETNALGIEERIGLGESEYAHSIANRVHNVSLTASKIHAKLIQPGEEFSFNKYLGDVSAATGFEQAYIIKEGQTILGDGGGVCQVSSTLFRAILNAGLPVTERRGHSYRVSYYEQNSKPGFDATVYDPHPDLRFKNDTTSPILVNAVTNSKKTYMYIELYGKSDGRVAEIKNYKQWGAQPAPPAVYQDDPTLKPGQVKQVEYAAPGLKTSFDYLVTYPGGEVKEKTFSTNYVPWRAVYLRGI